ncbi:MAG: amino acid ABC transporter ATP-binding protein [Actinobacteria bacterium]|jgi:polar amino acid transport system ATP-binding protein|nr:amino acid ABC transporter ATP-binding protein [Actinomycetota bacterium]NBP53477.1 amino acid ABC transporter ATP-binding protein [Actinomycetota bacterium]
MTALLSIRNVHKSFGSNDVLRGISLDVPRGSVVAFIGASGSGKSTLLRCLNLLEPIDDGEIILDGTDISAPGFDANVARRDVGLVFQSYNLFPHMNVLRNVTLALTHAAGIAKDEAESTAKELLDRFGLADKARAYPEQLSGGQQQRVAIIRAVALRPSVLLLDEVTAALDPQLVGEVLDLIAELRNSGMTMLMATHEMNFARDVADTVCFLHEGTIHEMGRPDEVLESPREERTKAFLARTMRR